MFQSQLGDVIHPTCPGSLLCPPQFGMCLGQLPRQPSRWHPHNVPKPLAFIWWSSGFVLRSLWMPELLILSCRVSAALWRMPATPTRTCDWLTPCFTNANLFNTHKTTVSRSCEVLLPIPITSHTAVIHYPPPNQDICSLFLNLHEISVNIPDECTLNGGQHQL